MPSLPPRPLCIVSALIIAAGTESVVGMIAKLLSGQFELNIGFVGILIGYGILIGKSSSRKWALFFAIAGLVVIAAGGALGVHAHWTGQDRTSHADRVFLIAAMTVAGAACLYVLRVLTRREFREWFATEKEDTSAAKTFAWAVAVVAAVLLSTHQTTLWWYQQTYERTLPFHVRVTPYDAVSGKGLHVISFRQNKTLPELAPPMKLPPVSTSTVSDADGMHLEFSGVADRPFEVTLGSEGFQDKIIAPDGHSEPEIRVPLQPHATGDAKPTPAGEK